MALKTEFTFNDKTYRHFINGFEAVMHCHHYMALTTMIAKKFDEYGGSRILAESAEDAVRPMFDSYAEKNSLPPGDERLKMAAEFYEVMGMGQMEAQGSPEGGQVMLTRSHVDQGWLTKFGPADSPLNYWTSGYISAMFGCAFEQSARGYDVVETSSIVQGEKVGKFKVKVK